MTGKYRYKKSEANRTYSYGKYHLNNARKYTPEEYKAIQQEKKVKRAAKKASQSKKKKK